MHQWLYLWGIQFYFLLQLLTTYSFLEEGGSLSSSSIHDGILSGLVLPRFWAGCKWLVWVHMYNSCVIYRRHHWTTLHHSLPNSLRQHLSSEARACWYRNLISQPCPETPFLSLLSAEVTGDLPWPLQTLNRFWGSSLQGL